MRTKRLAESQFDSSAASISLGSFMLSLEKEKFDLDFHLDDEEKSVESPELEEIQFEEPAAAIVPCLASAFLCNVENQYEDDYGLDQSFEDNLNLISTTMNTSVQNILELDNLTVEQKRSQFSTTRLENVANFDDRLFIERRLFQSLQYMRKIDKNFVDQFFPMRNEAFHISSQQLFNDDEHGCKLLLDLIDRWFDGPNIFLKDYYVNFNIIEYDKIRKKKNINMDSLFVAGYILKHHPQHLINRFTKVRFISNDLSGLTVSDLQIDTVFKQLGVNFFSAFGIFNDRKRYIANMIIGRLNDHFIENKKKKNQVLIYFLYY